VVKLRPAQGGAFECGRAAGAELIEFGEAFYQRLLGREDAAQSPRNLSRPQSQRRRPIFARKRMFPRTDF
jgi:hypothetical protein